VFDHSSDFAPGPDGYPGHFYKYFWPIIHTDVIKARQYFFTNNYILPNLNSNLLVLIPRTLGADKLENFRPINLSYFQFKVITKILADRLGSIASRIFSKYRRGFIHNIGHAFALVAEICALVE